MPSTHLVRHIAHPADELLAMVADVENYPKFINLISALRITKKLSDTDFEAEAIVAYKVLRETFKSQVHVDKTKRIIRVFKADKGGALKALENLWVFHPLDDGSTMIEFSVDVSLKAFPLNILIREKMGKATSVILGAFEARAAQICQPVETTAIDVDAQCKALGISLNS
ncbi:MAG: SRPBCC family protein [Litorimonas sp.]